MKKEKDNIQENLEAIQLKTIYPAVGLIASIFIFLLMQKGDFREVYTSIQQNIFIKLNHYLASFPLFEWNITQIGDAVVGFALVSILLYYAPRFWAALINASLLSLITSGLLKALFAMPRPASIIPKEDFTIIGKELLYKSLPSGHSMTIFIFITLLAIAFFPRKESKTLQLLWALGCTALGLFIASSRVAVGAHWPLDVLTGSLIGYCLAILGVLIAQKTSFKAEFKTKHTDYAGLFISATLIILLSIKLIKESLLIYYLAFIPLILTIYLICRRLKSYKA